MLILGIETSCDETAAAIVDQNGTVLAHALYSQMAEHLPHGGVVPEIAARAHANILDDLIRTAATQADMRLNDLGAIAATCGPGLIGGVMVGMMTAKAMAAALGKPFIAINHLEAHVLMARMGADLPFPYLTLLISGGHTQLLLARGVGDYQLLGESLDDAAGEAFDKSAKLMGLPYPGGPMIEKLAATCADPARAAEKFPLPRPLTGRKGCDFSFSGLKTAMRLTVQDHAPLNDESRVDLCASLQTAIGDILCDRVSHALSAAQESGARHFVLAGGVAANQYLRTRLSETVAAAGMEFIAPPLKLCTDNGVMIAWAGIERFRAGIRDSLSVPARPRWPLSELTGVST